jgi:hypothetical protein
MFDKNTKDVTSFVFITLSDPKRTNASIFSRIPGEMIWYQDFTPAPSEVCRFVRLEVGDRAKVRRSAS